MKLLGLIEEDFVNYKVTCMTVLFPYCSFKCNKEAGEDVCQNSHFLDIEPIDIDESEIVIRYVQNPISEALVMQGLEPFDSYNDLCSLIQLFVEFSDDDIVIYTGYTEEEVSVKVKYLRKIIPNNKLIVKFGRFIPGQKSHEDPVLKVDLASDNQYAKIF